MNSDGVVTINGAEGTPAADWCVTIGSSDSDGGEYIVTEHRRDADVTAAADGDDDDRPFPDEDRASRNASDSTNGRDADRRLDSESSDSDTFEVRGAENVVERSVTSSATMLRAETMAHHLSMDLSETVSQADSEEESEEEFREEGSGGVFAGGGREQPGGREGEGGGGERSGGPRRQEGSGPDTPERRHAPFSPTPPQTTSPSSEGESSGPSVAKRFAKWIVQSTHVGGKKKRGDAESKKASKLSHREKEGGASGTGSGTCGGSGGGGGGKRQAAATAEEKEGGASRSSGAHGVRRPRAVSVKGFVPVRVGHVSMTCPLPSRLPFHPDPTEEEFDAPTFGTTVLGNSHGFDPRG